MPDWNPELYLQFEDGRNKPIYDLIYHMPIKTPKRIIDIGCGPGNSTIQLKNQFSEAEIVGVDNSPTMIEKAQNTYPEITWLMADINENISNLGKFDVVFSNSVLHWLPDHHGLLPRLFDLLNIGGVIAVQIPYFFGTPIYEPLYKLIENEKWGNLLPAKNPTNYYDIGYYYDILSSNFSVFDIWTTKHTHVLKSKDDIIDWYKATGFKPFLDQLDSDETKTQFLADVDKIIDTLYVPQKDNKYLFKFERLFFIAKRTE